MTLFLETFLKAIAIGFVSFIVLINLIYSSPPKIYEQKRDVPATSTPAKATTITPLTTATSSLTASTTPPLLKTKNQIATTTKKKVAANPLPPALPKESLELLIKPPIIQTILPTINEINELGRKAIVNIFCYTETAGTLRPLTGSGVIIDERGVILTNAHLAQYFLLRDYPVKNNVTCIIRTGSPATPAYTGELLYLSPPWVEQNHKNVVEENPLGTGEHDFGLILITGATNGASLPATFPAVTLNTEEFDEQASLLDNYVVVGYPAGFLGGLNIVQNLYISSTVANVKQLFTFKNNTIDVFSLGGSVLAQKGSSGGAVIRQKDKKLVGIIVTTTEETTTAERDLRAITTTHINRSIKALTNQDLPDYLSGNLYEKVPEFRINRFNYLKSLLVNELQVQ